MVGVFYSHYYCTSVCNFGYAIMRVCVCAWKCVCVRAYNSYTIQYLLSDPFSFTSLYIRNIYFNIYSLHMYLYNFCEYKKFQQFYVYTTTKAIKTILTKRKKLNKKRYRRHVCITCIALFPFHIRPLLSHPETATIPLSK